MSRNEKKASWIIPLYLTAWERMVQHLQTKNKKHQSLNVTQFSKLFHLWRISIILKEQYIEEKLHCLESILATLTSRKVNQTQCPEMQFKYNFKLASEAFILGHHRVQIRTSLPHTYAQRTGLILWALDVFSKTFCVPYYKVYEMLV